jgi:uncharacterized protein (TIGR02217 family)
VSNLVYPSSLPGLTFGNTRSPAYNTGIQAALSGKESRIAYQQYPLMTFELQYELLRDYSTPSDLKALTGLFMACNGKWDTFLFTDPAFNTVAAMPFATADGVTAAYQITATYQNTAGPGGAELIQNFNGVPAIFVGGVLQTSGTAYTLGLTGIITFLSGHIPAASAVLTWTGSFFYRCRFDDDSFTVSQFLSKFWDAKRVTIRQVKL